MTKNPDMKKVRIAIIGAGCSGLTMIKGLLDYGFSEIVCYEQNSSLGGNWLFSMDPSHSSVIETTHIISSKLMSQFEDFPMPEHYPDYPSHHQVLSYFKAYADHFNLLPYIRFNTKVVRTELDGDQWTLETDEGEVEKFSYLILANGHHSVPRYPNLPGEFSGELIHAHSFKNNHSFKNKRVLVIGGGNSACDCAVECGRIAEKVSISMRRPHYIIPKFIMGQPTDLYNHKMKWIPEWLAKPLRKVSLYLQIGSYRWYGLEAPRFSVTEDHPTINSELLYYLRHGKVNARKGVQMIAGNTVTFEDGIQEDFDVIIAATGYKISTPFLKNTMIDYSEADRIDLYLRMFHPDYDRLIFAGLVQPQGAIWPLVEAQSKLIAHYIGGSWKLPDNVHELARKEADAIANRYLHRKRHTIEVDFHEYLDRVKGLIPKEALV